MRGVNTPSLILGQISILLLLALVQRDFCTHRQLFQSRTVHRLQCSRLDGMNDGAQSTHETLTSLEVLSVLQCLVMSLVDQPLFVYPKLLMDLCPTHRHEVQEKI